MDDRPPEVPPVALDTVWFQVAGTICNLRCTHCFISCAPDNHSHGMMTRAQVRAGLDEAVRLGAREYYFTGGEPFMNRELTAMIDDTLAVGPATILTNGLFLDDARCADLRRLAEASEYSLDVRVSLDGWGPRDHDDVRGAGTFERAVEGILRLHAAGLNPVITVSEVAGDVAGGPGRLRFLARLREIGLTRPRLKVLPVWKIGAERTRGGGYGPEERLSAGAVDVAAVEQLQCATGRMVTARGVYVCPILIEEPGARMGSTLAEALRPFPLAHGACHTCYTRGVTCRT